MLRRPRHPGACRDDGLRRLGPRKSWVLAAAGMTMVTSRYVIGWDAWYNSKLPYPFRDKFDPMQRIFDAFGPNRTFRGTDITRMPCSYRECVTMFTEEIPRLKGADKKAVMGKALCDWVGWR